MSANLCPACGKEQDQRYPRCLICGERIYDCWNPTVDDKKFLRALHISPLTLEDWEAQRLELEQIRQQEQDKWNKRG